MTPQNMLLNSSGDTARNCPIKFMDRRRGKQTRSGHNIVEALTVEESGPVGKPLAGVAPGPVRKGEQPP